VLVGGRDTQHPGFCTSTSRCWIESKLESHRILRIMSVKESLDLLYFGNLSTSKLLVVMTIGTSNYIPACTGKR
jgi:hypothetical protein